MKILIVDDDQLSRRALKIILKKLGHCDTASGGLSALDLFRRAHFAQQPYNLLTLDYMMPGLHGPGLLLKIRGIEERVGIPEQKQVKVLMVTVQSDKDSVLKSASAGCHDYIIKPFNHETVFNRVKKLGIQTSQAELRMKERDPDEKELNEIFIKELGKRINRMQESMESSNFENIQNLAHQIHGTGSTYGFSEASYIGAEIEAAAKSGDLSSIKNGIKTLVTLFNGYKV
ncbi:MAG TPA: response regulator [Candidatus Marinimicrobia bacterium]|nr:response regulator [Candidatus Neomarinimicrobiota bacterium]